MRALFREIFSANLLFTGIVITAAAIVVFYGAVYLIVYTDVGKKLGFLITGAAIFGWNTLGSLFFVLYAPRGPRPEDIEGLNAFQIRIIPLAFMIASAILFAMFLYALARYEAEQERLEP